MIIYGAEWEKSEAYAKDFAKHGIDSVCVGENGEYLDAYRRKGMKIYLSVGAFSIGEMDESHQARDVYGKPQIWFSSGCPNDPEIRKRNLKEIERKCQTEGIEGILIDGARFSSPCSSNEKAAFFTCFCPRCMEKAGKLGFDAEGMRRGAQALLEFLEGKESDLIPYLGDIRAWFEFRRICSTEHLRDFARVVHGYGLKAGAFLFSPSMAWMVGQDYGDLRGEMDIFLPMIYPAYVQKEGPACLNHELARLARWLKESGKVSGEKAVETLLRPLGISCAAYQSPEDVLLGLPPEIARHECRRVKERVGDAGKTIPILDLNDENIGETIQEAKMGGADEIALFLYDRAIYERYKEKL